jgi:hypothetical protein
MLSGSSGVWEGAVLDWRHHHTTVPVRADPGNVMETEADDFAGRVLLPRAFDGRLAAVRSQAEVIAVARDAGVHPGIVVGRLLCDGQIPYGRFSGLRARSVVITSRH